MKKIRLLFIIIILFSISISFNSCGNKNEAGSDKKEESKQEVRKDVKDPTSEVKKEDPGQQSKEDMNKSNELGMTPGLPSNFPSDVPQPKNSKTLGSLNSSEGTVVTFESNDKVLDIVNFYKEEMKKNGYTISEEGETLVNDKGGLINWKKDNKEVGLMLGFDKDKNITSLVITYK